MMPLLEKRKTSEAQCVFGGRAEPAKQRLDMSSHLSRAASFVSVLVRTACSLSKTGSPEPQAKTQKGAIGWWLP